jgi:hypothetical protein
LRVYGVFRDHWRETSFVAVVIIEIVALTIILLLKGPPRIQGIPPL